MVYKFCNWFVGVLYVENEDFGVVEIKICKYVFVDLSKFLKFFRLEMEFIVFFY